MPVKFRITVLFSLLVLIILTLVCGSVYYFSYQNRMQDIRTRLTNRAITTGKLLSQTGIFDINLIQKIDESTTVAMKDKIVEAYDFLRNKIYRYSDKKSDSIRLSKSIFENAKENKAEYFTMGEKDAIAYYFSNDKSKMIIIAAAFDEEGKKKLSELKLVLWLSFVGGMLISLIGGYLFSLRLLHPLRKITDEVNDISARSLTSRISITGNKKDEWFYLADTLNRLLNRLEESFDIQGRFIANASHELSTPLTSISSQLEVALQRKRNENEYQQIIQSVYEDVKHLNKLTLSLLEFAKASGTSSGLEIELIRIDEILLRLPAEIVKMGERFTVMLDFNELPEQEEKLLVFAQEELLFSAIKNIVANACKYSGDHKASVNLYVLDHEVKITVRDSGKGIDKSEIDKIFQPFYRIDDDRQISGFGLGLPLSNRIIKLHKGALTIESEINKGTIITISLPDASRFTKI